MQFHLDGFRTGDPDIQAPAEGLELADDGLPEEVDVLIVGCGPAGLTLAAQLAAFPQIRTRIVEQKDGPLELGQADGIACRTMEMFNAFGFAERVMREAYWVNETVFWKPDETAPETIVRSGRIQDVEDDLSEFPHVILNQARVHRFYLDVMRNAPRRLEPDYARRLVGLEVDPADAGAPVTVTLERTDREGARESVRARYVVGCDGARSAVRAALGLSLRGDSASQAWGVMDVLAVTDFPDIRLKAAIHSAGEGSIVLIPREGGYLVRLYTELDKLAEDERVASRNITVDHLVAAVRRIIRPYDIEVKEVAWWSVYEIGQRLCDRFDDGDDASARPPRVFIAGDACHTHSPKAGQGMNVSMQDAFNLGWKLASVILGRAGPELLRTYSAERQAVARELIDFDREIARLISGRTPAGAGGADGADPAAFQQYFQKQGRFTAGTSIGYRPSSISAEPTHQHLAKGETIGMRFHSAPVIRLGDARPMQLGHVVKADGRWRLFAFGGTAHPADPASLLWRLCDFLAESPLSPARRYTPKGDDIDSVMDVRAVFQRGHRELAVEAMHPFLLPRKGRYALIDYEKMFCADPGAGHIYDMRGIDRRDGCMIVVRPDQHVAHVLPLGAHDELATFFEGVMLPKD